jgi:hypothetical protein
VVTVDTSGAPGPTAGLHNVAAETPPWIREWRRWPAYTMTSRRARRGGSDTYYAPLQSSQAFPFGHPPGATGGAWSWRRDALDIVGGMLDTCVLGSADWHMAFGLVQATNVASETKRCTQPYVESSTELASARRETESRRRPLTHGVHRQFRNPCFSWQQSAARLWRAVGSTAEVGTSIHRPTSREITRDCGAGQETNLDSAMSWRNISSNARKTARRF